MQKCKVMEFISEVGHSAILVNFTTAPSRCNFHCGNYTKENIAVIMKNVPVIQVMFHYTKKYSQCIKFLYHTFKGYLCYKTISCNKVALYV